MKKILGICGSPNGEKSTTLFALRKTLEECSAKGFETEIIQLSQYSFGGCVDCGACRKKLTCSQKDDFTEKLISKLNDPDIAGFVFASPVYFGGITGQLKSFLDRAVIFRRNGFLFANKIAGALTVGRSRNGGQELAAMDIIKSALIHGMAVVSDAAPTSHFGGNLWSGHPDSITGDDSGIETARNLGINMAYHAARE
ncbi:MAG: flavodoxin family protein [Deltaproteobacteria bacterium]|nr:flavodoxin family protein [Deltaproteobacteria bacterium]MBN2673389.1 flavodoxin family protein [Deltaproteobacteria bacterium]